jgi:hypothetical protein
MRATNQKRKEKKEKTKAEKKMDALLGMPEKTNEKNFNDQEKEVVDLLQLMLNKNHNLRHLNLSDTGLSANMILEVSKAIKANNSILAIHLSGNPGLTETVICRLTTRLVLNKERRFDMSSFN